MRLSVERGWSPNARYKALFDARQRARIVRDSMKMMSPMEMTSEAAAMVGS
jgi:hypothetical protein